MQKHSPIDYHELGLRAGLEAHQQLLTDTKMYVYDTGCDLMDIGVISLDNMLPETALIKFSWLLAHTDDHTEVMRMMREPTSHEITLREPHNGYLILQGGFPVLQPRSSKPAISRHQ